MYQEFSRKNKSSKFIWLACWDFTCMWYSFWSLNSFAYTNRVFSIARMTPVRGMTKASRMARFQTKPTQLFFFDDSQPLFSTELVIAVEGGMVMTTERTRWQSLIKKTIHQYVSILYAIRKYKRQGWSTFIAEIDNRNQRPVYKVPMKANKDGKVIPVSTLVGINKDVTLPDVQRKVARKPKPKPVEKTEMAAKETRKTKHCCLSSYDTSDSSIAFHLAAINLKTSLPVSFNNCYSGCTPAIFGKMCQYS